MIYRNLKVFFFFFFFNIHSCANYAGFTEMITIIDEFFGVLSARCSDILEMQVNVCELLQLVNSSEVIIPVQRGHLHLP